MRAFKGDGIFWDPRKGMKIVRFLKSRTDSIVVRTLLCAFVLVFAIIGIALNVARQDPNVPPVADNELCTVRSSRLERDLKGATQTAIEVRVMDARGVTVPSTVMIWRPGFLPRESRQAPHLFSNIEEDALYYVGSARHRGTSEFTWGLIDGQEGPIKASFSQTVVVEITIDSTQDGEIDLVTTTTDPVPSRVDLRQVMPDERAQFRGKGISISFLAGAPVRIAGIPRGTYELILDGIFRSRPFSLAACERKMVSTGDVSVCHVVGRVTDESGHPLSGVLVVVADLRNERLASSLLRAVTESSGLFRLRVPSDAAAPWAAVQFQGRGCISKKVPMRNALASSLEIQLTRIRAETSFDVLVRPMPIGPGIAPKRVFVNLVSESGQWRQAWAEADSKGEFRAHFELEPGSVHRLIVDTVGFEPQIGPSVVVGGTGFMEVGYALRRGRSLVGHVRNRLTGAAVVGARVYLTGQWNGLEFAVADTDGVFRIHDSLPRLPVTLCIEANGFHSRELEVSGHADEVCPTRIELDPIG